MRQRRSLELLKDDDCDLLYHPDKAYVVVDALSCRSHNGGIGATFNHISMVSGLIEKIKAKQEEALREENLKEE